MRYRTWTGNETDRWSRRVDREGSEDNHPLRQCARVENRVRCYIYTRGMNLPISFPMRTYIYIAKSFQLSRSYMFYMAVNADVEVTSRETEKRYFNRIMTRTRHCVNAYSKSPQGVQDTHAHRCACDVHSSIKFLKNFYGSDKRRREITFTRNAILKFRVAHEFLSCLRLSTAKYTHKRSLYLPFRCDSILTLAI